jgi:integrase
MTALLPPADASSDVASAAVSPTLPAATEPLLPEPLIERLSDFFGRAERAMAPRTIAALRSDGRLFAGWCAGRGLSWLPAEPTTVAAFVDAVGASRKPATIKRYLVSIAAWHAAADLANPCRSLTVRMAARAHARARTVRQRQAKPVGEKEIDAILAAVGSGAQTPHRDLIGLRDSALLLVARDTLCRASEVVALRWEDLEDGEDGEGSILVRRSKTDQEGAGAARFFADDTMRALAAWRTAIGRAIDPATRAVVPSSPFVFRHLSRRGYGPALSPTSYAAIVKARSASIGLSGAYSGHSTRVGGAQDLVAAGEDLPAVMQAGGWKSPAMVARYTERLQTGRGAVARVRRRRRAETPVGDE